MKTTITISCIIMLLISNFGLVSQTNTLEEQYIQTIMDERAQRDQAMTDPSRSPLTEAQMQKFSGLSYFDIDPAFKLNAILTKDRQQGMVSLTLTDNSSREFTRYGTVSFSINGRDYTFTVFVNNGLPEFGEGTGQLFMPFTDATSGNESGDNGRYIAIEAPAEGNVVELDFNRAYLTFNDYNSVIVSTMSPPTNQMPVPLTIGQRKFEDRL
jgi:uncharacterized protein